ncbi:MAG: zinc-finger domain-containing protein [Pseudomonadota bacterium]
MGQKRHGTVDQILTRANAQNRYDVTADDLPLSCPMPDMYLWNAHPKVYLPIEETGSAKCSYCGALYRLVTPE